VVRLAIPYLVPFVAREQVGTRTAAPRRATLAHLCDR
jgi:hypothetical protein